MGTLNKEDRVMKRRATATCAATAVAAMVALSGPAAATPFPGPDGFGYTGTAIPVNLRNVSGSGTFVPLEDDQVSVAIPVPFTFNFYGVGYTQLFISSNGFIAFTFPPGAKPDGCCLGRPLPQNDPGADGPWNNLIAGFWEDLTPPFGGQIRYQTLGGAPNREFVVGFYHVSHFSGSSLVPVTFEMILHEGSDAIELQYGSAPSDSDGFSTSVGIEDATGTIGLQVALGEDVAFNNQGFLITADSDGDGILDNIDACPNSDLSATVVIDDCEFGVTNALDGTGCTIADGIGQCADGAINHGDFVSCAAHLTNDLKKDGVISGREKGAIQRCAAQADLP